MDVLNICKISNLAIWSKHLVVFKINPNLECELTLPLPDWRKWQMLWKVKSNFEDDYTQLCR